MHGRVGLEAGGLQPGLDHAQAAGGEDGAPERLVGLQADDHLVVAVDVARRVREQLEGVAASTSSTPFFRSSCEVGLQLRPDRLGARRRADEERSSPS